MSGLLQRLAARALGQTPSVRPIVGWSAPPVPAGIVLAEANADVAPTAAGDVPPLLGAAPREARSHEELREPAIPAPPSPLAMPPAPARAPESEPADTPSPAAAARERPIADRFAPLLPVTRSRSPSSGTKPNSPARAREELTEVHVNIGRIELTAVHDAPRPRREPARTRKPQSLEDYLKRREAERR